jgi:cytochrome c-type biogenesis protein CcmF
MNVIGYYSILIALFLAGYSSLAAIMGVKGRRGELITSSENAAMAVFAFITLASGAMVYALLTRDFQVEYVWNYTNRSLSWFYTLTAFYAGQKGSLLLWAWLLSIFSVIVVFQNRKKNRELIPYVIGVLMVITFFFTILMVFSTNPFEQFTGRPVDGQGLNPLLQNPGMIFHPPTLYLGYVGFTVPFAFSIAALITGKLGDVWIKTTRRWTIFSWFFLTIGNLFGMEWAYVELGWGGYWAWDPVENASFLPWVMGTAYLHSVMIQEKRGMLKVWNMVLILLTFLLTIFGTFITRSGIIASVHSFGESTLGWIFLIFLFVVLICSLLLLIYRLPHLKSRNQLDSLLSRESTFLYNNLLFVGITFTVFWGTLFPIISEAVRGVKITVGPPFFNTVLIPLGLALLFLTGLCPLVAWRRTTLQKFTKKVLFPSLFSLIGAGVLLLFGIRSFYPLITFTFCIFVFAILVAEFFNGTRARHALSGEGYFLAFYNLVARNKRRYGGYVIHFGIILIFMGFGGNAFNMERQITLNKGESFSIKNYTLRYEALSNYPTTQMDKTVATLTLFNDNHKVGVLSPEKSLYKNQDQPTTEVAIHSTLKEDVYVILAGYEKELATFKVLVNPLVIWIWIGGAIMGIGTVIVMLPNRKRKKDQTS